MARKNQRRKKRPIIREVPAKPIESDAFQRIKCVCLVCGSDTGKEVASRASIIDPRELGKDPKVRSGLCVACTELQKKGHTLFFSDTRGAILSIEGNAKLKPKARGGLWKIPEEKMDELMGKGYAE